jgi:hypothetical protein
MQQNAFILHRRATSIVHSRPFLGLPRFALPRSFAVLRHQFQRRCLSNSKAGGSFIGDLGFPQLGGKHYFRVEIPSGSKKDDRDAWLQALDTCLPAHLRRDEATSEERKGSDLITIQRDVSLLLIEAQRQASFDVLEHLGVVQQRWDAVSWIVQTVAQRGAPRDLWSEYPSTVPLTFGKKGLNLEEAANHYRPWLVPQRQPRSLGMSLDQLTFEMDPQYFDTRVQRGALGQVWQSLGSIIIRAAEDTAERRKLMPHTLSLLATLHHYGIVPESIYRDTPNHDCGRVQQSPLLYLFSSRILTALSDAAWEARQATVTETEKSGRGQYSSWNFGLESPGVRYRATSQELMPEVWLELVLWSCLSGGWVQEGAAILEQIAPAGDEDEDNWSLICWRSIIEDSPGVQVHQPTFGWRDALDLLEGARPELQPRPSADDKALVVRTVSSELVSAYVDASISTIHVGVGQRGVPLRQVLNHVKRWKRMLGRQNLGLGFATWDAIVQKFMESGGIWLERDPTLALEILQLVEPYGKEQEAANVAAPAGKESALSSYFIGASALPLNLLHRVLYAQAHTGSLDGTMTTLKVLQDYTELNQRRSIEQFFRDLKERPNEYQRAASHGLLFDTGLAAAEYPSFYPQIPVHVLAQFLGVARGVQDNEFYNWVFDSGSAVGPLISDSMYEEAGLAPALVRFASATDNQAVLQNVMTHHSQLSRKQNTLIPTPILTALVETLIQRRKWPSVRNVLRSLTNEPSEEDFNAWDERLIPTLIREILRIEHDKRRPGHGRADELVVSMHLFIEMTEICLAMPRRYSGRHESDVLFCCVALLASVDKNWGKFCSDLHIMPPRAIPLKIRVESFNAVLEGVLESRGLGAARKYWDTWCHTAEYLHRAAVAEGGIFEVPSVRPTSYAPETDTRYRIFVESTNIHDIDIAGRISPDLHGTRLLLNALRADKGKRNLSYDFEEMHGWLRSYLEALSQDKFMTGTSLAKLADALEQPDL